MVKVHKRRKNSRIRGARTVGWGFRQKHKGHGNKGGFGKAGTGKRADHKKQSAEIAVKGKYFGKQGITSRGTKRDKRKRINLKEIGLHLEKYGKKSGDKFEVNLKDHKILGEGEIKNKLIIFARQASKTAIEKVKKAGGEIKLGNKVDKAKKSSKNVKE